MPPTEKKKSKKSGGSKDQAGTLISTFLSPATALFKYNYTNHE